LKALLETGKNPSRLLGDVQRFVLESGSSSERPTDVLHPSEIAHDDWCRRAAYCQLAGLKPSGLTKPLHWRMAMIFDEGKEIHQLWQNRIWAIGRLTGQFLCLKCGHFWWDTAPNHCFQCSAAQALLVYREVPLFNRGLHIAGHADGFDRDEAVIEIKSVGLGTLRFEAPQLLKQHTYRLNINGREREFIDYDGLWDAIRRPFPSHIRQAHLYSFLGAPEDEIFLYQCKWNQKVKEFVVRYREERIADLLDDVRLIKRALEEHKPPSCRHGGCPECELYEESLDRPARPRRLIRRPSTPPAAPNGGRVPATVQRPRQQDQGPGLQRVRRLRANGT